MIKKIDIDPRIKPKNINDLIELPVVIRINKFNEDGAKAFSEDLNKAHETGQPVIPIVVDSYGGQVYSFLSMLSELEQCRLPVATICESKAMSAGCFLFSMGKKGMRYMSPHATLMLHEVSSFTVGKVEDLKADVDEVTRLNDYLFKLLAKNCGKPANYFVDLMHKKGHADLFLDPKDSKKHGLCDNIGIPKFEVKLSLEYSFK